MLRRNPRDLFALRRLPPILIVFAREFDTAERLLRRSLRLAPRDRLILRELAGFLFEIRGDPDAAERIHLRILRLRSVHPLDMTNYANFLCAASDDYDEAEHYYRRACADPRARPPCRLALGRFLIIYRGRFEEGEALLDMKVPEERKAALDPVGDLFGFGALPATRDEWISQIEWCAFLAQFDPDTAAHYALLKKIRPEFFPEDR
jgi:tetratricopeptide (TPR) repeat protein